MTETGKTNQSAQGKRMLQQLHDQGVIDLDAPMRQLFDKMDATGDVSGYQLTGPEDEKVWAYYIETKLPDGTTNTRTLVGSGLKDDPGLKG